MEKRRALFVCTGNSCRSQMAEGLLRHLAGDRFDVFSAGTHPSFVNPRAIEAMAEIGIDISGQTSNGVNEYAHESFDLVVTVCDSANARCPVFPGGGRRLHWSIDDPFEVTGPLESQQAAFRRVRDDLRARISVSLEEWT